MFEVYAAREDKNKLVTLKDRNSVADIQFEDLGQVSLDFIILYRVDSTKAYYILMRYEFDV